MLFQKNSIFIGVRATTENNIQKNKISKKVLTHQKFNETHQLQTLISSKL